jgi:pimeloyl-ACP methyl ester carboxylesterase
LAAHAIVDAMSIKGITAANAVFRKTDLPAKLARHHGDKTEAVFRAWADIWLSDRFRDWSIEDCLPAIGAPCLALQGRNDEYGLPDQVHRIAAGTSGFAQTGLIPDCAHAPHRDAPGATIEAIVAFLDGPARGRAASA